MFVSFLWGMLHLAYACLISGLCWTILGYVSAMLGSCWTISVYFLVLLLSAFVGHEFGPHWPYPGPLWAMVAPYWGHVEPFWAILGAVLSMQGVCKKHCKYQQQIQFLVSSLMVFAPFFGLCLFLFFWGMLHLVYACLISGLCWTILGYVSAMLGSCWTISVYFVVLLAFVGCELGPYWPYPGPLWTMLGHFGVMLAACWAHVEPF